MRNRGEEVCVVSGDEGSKSKIEECGITFINIKLTRKGKNIYNESMALKRLFDIISQWEPELVHMFTIKPVIYGTLINRFSSKFKNTLFVASITGLGSLSLSTKFIDRFLWILVKMIYRKVLILPNVKVIFENTDDMKQFVDAELVCSEQVSLVNGAGVSTEKFTPSGDKYSKFTVVLVARLIVDKGIREYISAAKILRQRNSEVELLLVGDVDPSNISSMTQSEIDMAVNNGYIKHLGFREDVEKIYQRSHVACLPSYREGLPKSLIEAAACGLPIITTNVPGCRQMVDSGRNGILVPSMDAFSLANAIETLSLSPSLIKNMGDESRQLALKIFDYKPVINQFLNVYSVKC